MIYELINPSDAITFEGDDDTLAAVSALVIGNGKFGLRDQTDRTVLPVFILGGALEWLESQGINLDSYLTENRDRIAGFLDTCLYGSVGERHTFNDAVSRMSADDAAAHKAHLMDRRRSSMSNIGGACKLWADHLRKAAVEAVKS